MEKENRYLGNKNYRKGRRKEYKICEELKKQGFDLVQRTAGSRSPIDIIAIDTGTRRILLIQSKPDNFATSKEIKLYEENKKFNGAFIVEFKVL